MRSCIQPVNKHVRDSFFLVSPWRAMSALYSIHDSLDLLLSAAPIESHVGAVVVRVRSSTWRTFMGQYVYFDDRTLPTPASRLHYPWAFSSTYVRFLPCVYLTVALTTLFCRTFYPRKRVSRSSTLDNVLSAATVYYNPPVRCTDGDQMYEYEKGIQTTDLLLLIACSYTKRSITTDTFR